MSPKLISTLPVEPKSLHATKLSAYFPNWTSLSFVSCNISNRVSGTVIIYNHYIYIISENILTRHLPWSWDVKIHPDLHQVLGCTCLNFKWIHNVEPYTGIWLLYIINQFMTLKNFPIIYQNTRFFMAIQNVSISKMFPYSFSK